MRLAELAVAEAAGAVLVHLTRAGARVLKKGKVLDEEDVAALAAAGIARVTCAVLDAEDVAEDRAAQELAEALLGPDTRREPAKTGRCNLFAVRAGLCVVRSADIDALNELDERVTVATLPDGTAVQAGEMIATIKIIPFAVPRDVLDELIRRARPPKGRSPALAIHGWRPKRAGLILTAFPETPPALLARAEAAQRERMARCAGELVETRVVPHELDAVTEALGELAAHGYDPILALGASAIMDREDVIPAAVVRAGGVLQRFGMPVDPGNLLLLASLPRPPGPSAQVIGVPGCARSLKRSGFDWVLERCCAGLATSSAEIARLGTGGLLEEIGLRPSPRAATDGAHDPARIAAIVLAAGSSQRMGSVKLLEPVGGQPLVRWAVEAALASRARPVVVVTGHRQADVAAAVADLDVMLVHNPRHEEGMASSLRAGVRAVEHSDAAVICLGDMPKVSGALINEVLEAFDPTDAPIVIPTHQHKRGNPVLWARRFFAEILTLRGDVGARALLERHADEICLLPVGDPAILLDVDTPRALELLRATSSPE